MRAPLLHPLRDTGGAGIGVRTLPRAGVLLSAADPTRPSRVPAAVERAWSAELRLLACLARIEPTEDDRTRARGLAAGPLDWDRWVRLAEHHGVAPLAHVNVERMDGLAMPDAARTRLRFSRLAMTRANLALHGRWVDLCAAFEDRAIRALTLKGFHVARLIYGDLGLRPVGDLDFLVRPADVAPAIVVLEEQGYRLFPHWERAVRHVGLEYVLAHATELGLLSDRGDVVDLHWAAHPRRMTPSTDALLASAERVVLDRGATLVSPVDTAMAMLVLHGHASTWRRLRWLVDVAEGLERLSADEYESTLDQLDACGMGSALANALALIETLWERAPAACRRAARRPRTVHRRLLRYAAAGLDELCDPNQMYDALRPMRLLRDRLGRVHTLGGAVASAAHPNHFDWAAVALPRALRVGYYGVRPIRLVRRALQARRRRVVTLATQVKPVRARLTVTAARDMAEGRGPAGRAVEHRASTPLTFVSAIYNSGPDSLLGGRGYDLSYYLPSLINIANLGAPMVLYCARQDAHAIEDAIGPHFSACQVIPFDLATFDYYAEFMEWKRAYRDGLRINDRNEVLCFLKLYWVQDAVARDPFGHERYFWIDSGLTHHGLFPQSMGGVELRVTAPPSHYYPHNPKNIFTPELGAAIGRAPRPGTTMFCAMPFQSGRRDVYETISAALFGRERSAVRIDEHLVGGLFGGHRDDLQAVHQRYVAVLEEFIRTRTYTLEEQIFSALHALFPELFSLRRFGTWHFYVPGEATSRLTADGDSFFKIFTGLLDEARRDLPRERAAPVNAPRVTVGARASGEGALT